ncbi:MAG: carboxylating nicotinate-nucleotide diphosphorylase [Bdellovibrionales bacterium]|nr:carboxylating nicotinate-nucleotide diphosphorylase [Bdellovibrionales bacterium]
MSTPSALPSLYPVFRELLSGGLREDGYTLDWTSLGLKRERKVRATIKAKADGVFYGAELARAASAVSESIDLPFSAKALVADGARVKAGTKVVEWKGNATGILALERPTLNLAGYLSGIATRTRGLVDRVEAEWKKKRYAGEPPRIVPTRKILPHYRDVGIAAVMAGGGYPHRVNLAGGVLIKENHIAAAGGIRFAIAAARKVAPHGLKIEIEVRNPAELKSALAERAEVILLDNFEPDDVRKALAIVKTAEYAPLIECSGGISEATVAAYAMPGVGLLSLGGLTHSVTALDLSLLVE